MAALSGTPQAATGNDTYSAGVSTLTATNTGAAVATVTVVPTYLVPTGFPLPGGPNSPIGGTVPAGATVTLPLSGNVANPWDVDGSLSGGTVICTAPLANLSVA